MRNLFKSLHKSRGHPDSTLHLQPGKHQNGASTLIPISAPPPPSDFTLTSVSEPSVPAGYPSNNYGYNNHPHTVQPPIAYPYKLQQDEGQPGAVLEFKTGSNTNVRGQQRGGNIKAANINSATASAAGPPVSLPSTTGRLVFSTGGNYNSGDFQESGNVEFANVG